MAILQLVQRKDLLAVMRITNLRSRHATTKHFPSVLSARSPRKADQHGQFAIRDRSVQETRIALNRNLCLMP